jgi:hypothetical protein
MIVFIFKKAVEGFKNMINEYVPSDYFQSLGVFEDVPAMRFAEFVYFLESKEKQEGNENIDW